MLHPRLTALALVLVTSALPNTAAAQDNSDGWRTIEFETTEVTAADVAVSPEGQWLIFTILGHLFQLPVEGGDAEQLTFGPYYDSEPVFSPDGSRIAFVSDRDGSEGNVFVLDLASGQITQASHESSVGRPTWTPDGQAIVYLRFTREARDSYRRGSVLGPIPSVVRRVVLRSGEAETLSTPPRRFRSVFYLPDGRLAWTVVERERGAAAIPWGRRQSPRGITRIEVMSPEGTVSTLRTVAGYADPVSASPTGEGLYFRRSPLTWDVWLPDPDNLIFVPLPDGADRRIAELARLRGWNPRFAVGPNDESLYVGSAGQLWKIELPSGTRVRIPFSARVTLEIQDPMPPVKPALPLVARAAPPRTILQPRLSPDGRRLVFGAAGDLWQQPLDGGPAQRLLDGTGLKREPAFSPDGRKLAFVQVEYGKGQVSEVRVFDFGTRQAHTVGSGWGPTWSPDGERLVFVDESDRLVVVHLSDGRTEELLTETGFGEIWSVQFSPDGQSLYFLANGTTLYCLPLGGNGTPEPVTQLPQLWRAVVSPDGKQVALQRNLMTIWVASLGAEPVREQHLRQFSTEGGYSFAFSPDGSALIYASGNRVWRHPLTGGERQEIPIRLELPRSTPPPLLLRRVRVLDFAAGGFGGETSVFIEEGRIRWIGSELGRQLPRQIITVDAAGRFAIPGLFDMHVHAAEVNQAAFLAYGVTSVRNMGGPLRRLNELVDRGEVTDDPIPRYFHSGDTFQGRIYGRGRIATEDEARTYVHRWKRRGVHFIKVYNTLSWPLQRAVAEEARRQKLPVVGHGTNVQEITRSVTLGYAVLEHMSEGDRVYDDVLQLLAAAGTRWDPTLTIVGSVLLLRQEPERVADPKLRAFTSEPCIRAVQTARVLEAMDTEVLRGFWVKLLTSIRAAHRRGIKLQAGTDVRGGEWLCFDGLLLHWELEFFVQAGIPPLEVLRIATQEAAAAVGAGDDLGTLEVGKLADIVLLDANPLDDIKNTQTIWRVIKGGWVFDPEKLRPERN